MTLKRSRDSLMRDRDLASDMQMYIKLLYICILDGVVEKAGSLGTFYALSLGFFHVWFAEMYGGN